MPTDLKSTINLPKSAFPMKAGLPQNEPRMLERWEQMRIYERIRAARIYDKHLLDRSRATEIYKEALNYETDAKRISEATKRLQELSGT